MMFVSIVGHASFHTAGASGPSTIERSYFCRSGRGLGGFLVGRLVEIDDSRQRLGARELQSQFNPDSRASPSESRVTWFRNGMSAHTRLSRK